MPWAGVGGTWESTGVSHKAEGERELRQELLLWSL